MATQRFGAIPASRLNNETTTAPTVNDDSGDGYAIGSLWYDTTADLSYLCLDATVGAAVWKDITAGAAGGEANTQTSQGTGEGTLAMTKSGVDLPIKSLKQGTGITLTNNANDVTIAASSAGDVTGPASSVDNEIALFNSTTGKLIKRASTTGIIKATAGVIGAASLGTDYGDVVADDTTTVVQNIVAYSTVGGKNLTELTGTQGDVLYHNGTSWVKLGAGAAGYFLRANGAAANPEWAPMTLFNQSVTAQGAGFATDTYLTGSSIAIPNSRLKIGTVYCCTVNMTKTAAGTATAIITVRIGTAGTTADTARCTFTFTAGTAAIDEAVIRIYVVFRSVGSGSSAVVQGLAQFSHRLSVTGFTGTAAVSEPEISTSAGFDSTVSNSIIGVSINGGVSAAWTTRLTLAELSNFA